MSGHLEDMQKDSFSDGGVDALYEKQGLSTEPIKCEDEVFTPINDKPFISSGTFKNEERPILSHIKEEPHFFENGVFQHMELQPSVSPMGEEPPPMELAIPKIHIDCQAIEVKNEALTHDLIKDEPVQHEEESLANHGMFACTNDDLVKDEPLGAEMEPPSIDDVPQPRGNAATGLLKDDSSPHICPLCRRKFSSFFMLERHRNLHKGMKLHCLECKADFCTKTDRVAHAKQHRKKSVSCLECRADFSSKNDLVAHFRDVHNRNFESCLECGEDFTNRADLAAHVQEHKVKSNLVYCSQCGADFLHKADLEVHMRKCHVQKCKVFCKACGKGFSSRVALRGHIRGHKDKRKNFCMECGECFSWRLDLIVHLKEHNGQAHKRCKECRADLSNEMDLAAHIRQDTGESHCPFKKTYTCPFCSRTFTRPSNLIKHSEKAVRTSCPQCDAKFCNNADLILHTRVHNRVSTWLHKSVFRCLDCDLTFSTNHDLCNHRKVHLLTCGECGDLFMNQDKFAEHVQVHGQLSCSHCGKRFTDETNLEEHVKVHLPFSCDHCGVRFAGPADLWEHEKLHRPVLFPCAQCGEKFVKASDLAEHMKVHTAAQVVVVTTCGQSPTQVENSPNHQQTHKVFPCSVCNKTFPSLSHLIVHETFHTATKLPL